MRGDYQAIALLVISIIANIVITNARPFLNGAAGVSLVPAPLADQIGSEAVNTYEYQYFYVALSLLCVGLVLFAANRIANSPYGRSLRAMRENEVAAAALGKNLLAQKLTMFIVGGIMGGLSGAIGWSSPSLEVRAASVCSSSAIARSIWPTAWSIAARLAAEEPPTWPSRSRIHRSSNPSS